MSYYYDRRVLSVKLIDADHKVGNGLRGNFGLLRKCYRLTLACGHTKDKWVITHIPSISRCYECRSNPAKKE